MQAAASSAIRLEQVASSTMEPDLAAEVQPGRLDQVPELLAKLSQLQSAAAQHAEELKASMLSALVSFSA